MAEERVLVTTFGFDESKSLLAMRRLPYDRLVVILGEDAMEGPGYRHLVEMERLTGKEVDARTVDVFDFSQCLREVTQVLREFNRPPMRAILNVSGGTKILADAAILAAFHSGVEAYHCEDELVSLPVIVGLTLDERFTRSQLAVLGVLRDGDTILDVADRIPEHGGHAIRKAVNSLIRMGVLTPHLDRGEVRLRVSEGQESLLHILSGRPAT